MGSSFIEIVSIKITTIIMRDSVYSLRHNCILNQRRIANIFFHIPIHTRIREVINANFPIHLYRLSLTLKRAGMPLRRNQKINVSLIAKSFFFWQRSKSGTSHAFLSLSPHLVPDKFIATHLNWWRWSGYAALHADFPYQFTMYRIQLSIRTTRSDDLISIGNQVILLLVLWDSAYRLFLFFRALWFWQVFAECFHRSLYRPFRSVLCALCTAQSAAAAWNH